jgi:hypothetical protein
MASYIRTAREQKAIKMFCLPNRKISLSVCVCEKTISRYCPFKICPLIGLDKTVQQFVGNGQRIGHVLYPVSFFLFLFLSLLFKKYVKKRGKSWIGKNKKR